MVLKIYVSTVKNIKNVNNCLYLITMAFVILLNVDIIFTIINICSEYTNKNLPDEIPIKLNSKFQLKLIVSLLDKSVFCLSRFLYH